MNEVNYDIELIAPHPAQQAVLNSSARFRVMMCGRRFGKSLISQDISIDHGINREQVAYITPTYQLGKIFFQEILKVLPSEIYRKNEADLVINFITGGSIRFFTGEKLDALRGLKFHLVIVDEAAYIKDLEEGWLNSIRPTLTDYKGKAIFLSTPKGKDYFYSLMLKNGEPDWEAFKFSTYDNPYIDKDEIDDAKRQLPHSVFEQEYMANPMENSANPFGYAFIQQCTYPLSYKEAVCYGIDLAKSSDFSVIIGIDKDGAVCHFDRFQMDWRSTTHKILALPNAQMAIDSTGVGDPIAEDIARVKDVELFKFTQQSKQQIMEGLALAIQQRKITFPEGLIKDELEIFEFAYTRTGVKYSAPQGFHDDCVCALALAWHKWRNSAGMSGHYALI